MISEINNKIESMRSNKILLILITLLLFCCTDEQEKIESGNGDFLELSYTLSASQVQTYATQAEASECKIDEIYALVFDASKTYKGYTKGQATSSSINQGSCRFGKLANGTPISQQIHFVFIANPAKYIDLNGLADVDAWLSANLNVGTTNLTQAKTALEKLAVSMSTQGLAYPYLMSGEGSKTSTTNRVTASLDRCVSRVDLINNCDDFILESAEIWNARNRANVLAQSPIIATDATNFINYTNNVATGILGYVKAKLYCFENYVNKPQQNDKLTTCLIVGGRYKTNTTRSYYRINIVPNDGEQLLKRNSLYSINITDINGAGDASKQDAYDNANKQMDYVYCNWKDQEDLSSFSDGKGNKIQISQRNVIFSEGTSQEVELTISRTLSTSSPIATDWSVTMVSGTYSTDFTIGKVTGDASNSRILVTVKSNNTLTTDKTADALLRWGSISIPITIKQLSTSGSMGIRANPALVLFENTAPAPQDVCVEILGNSSNISSSNIESAILYEGSHSGWLKVAYSRQDAQGFHYTLTADPLTAEETRSAYVKFTVKDGLALMTSQVFVTQSNVAGGGIVTTQNGILVDVYTTAPTTSTTGVSAKRGSLPAYAVQGLPADAPNPKESLRFAVNDKKAVKYVLTMSLSWQIIPDANCTANLTFDKLSGTASQTLTVEAKNDAVDDGLTAWSGVLNVLFDDGSTTPVNVYQKEILGIEVANFYPYYYGIQRMNGKNWLDRDIGAKSNGFYSNAYTAGTDGKPAQDVNAKGGYYTRAQAKIACPKGYRIPKTQAYGRVADEWNWVYDNVKWSSGTGNGTAVNGALRVNYVIYDTNKIWYLNNVGVSTSPNNPYIIFWSDDADARFYLYNDRVLNVIDNNATYLTYSQTVRCIEDK